MVFELVADDVGEISDLRCSVLLADVAVCNLSFVAIAGVEFAFAFCLL